MGVIEYNKEPDSDAIEYTENDIINKIDNIQNQLIEFGQILKEIKKDIEQLKQNNLNWHTGVVFIGTD